MNNNKKNVRNDTERRNRGREEQMGRAKAAASLETEAENEAETKRSPIAPDCREPSATLEYID